MAPSFSKKRKLEDGMRGKTTSSRKRKFTKQTDYHSSSDDSGDDATTDPKAVNLEEDSDEESAPAPSIPVKGKPATISGANATVANDESSEETGASSEDELDDEDIDSLAGSSTRGKTTSKRNDPNAFSTSITKILGTKLSQSARKDPVLARSKEAAQASHQVADQKLESKAKSKLRTDKKEVQDKGRVRDVLGLATGEAGETAEEEKRLRKTAQKGVIKLFNAVRAAQVKGEEAARAERHKGTVGLDNRQERVNEVSKQGFLELINGKSKNKPIEEA